MHKRQVFLDTSKVQHNFFIQQSIHTNSYQHKNQFIPTQQLIHTKIAL